MVDSEIGTVESDPAGAGAGMHADNWAYPELGMRCATCRFFVLKRILHYAEPMVAPDYMPPHPPPLSFGSLGRCRKRAPTLRGFPAVFDTDWCGDHRLDENRVVHVYQR